MKIAKFSHCRALVLWVKPGGQTDRQAGNHSDSADDTDITIDFKLTRNTFKNTKEDFNTGRP